MKIEFAEMPVVFIDEEAARRRISLITEVNSLLGIVEKKGAGGVEVEDVGVLANTEEELLVKLEAKLASVEAEENVEDVGEDGVVGNVGYAIGESDG